MVEPQQMENRGIKIVHFDGVDGGFKAVVVALAVAETILHAGAGEEASKGIGIVIATRAIALQERHTPELGSPDDERIFEQSAALHVS